MRVGSNTVRAKKENIEELMRINTHKTYDEEGIQCGLKELSNTLLNEVYSKITENKLITEKIITQDLVNPRRYIYSNQSRNSLVL